MKQIVDKQLGDGIRLSMVFSPLFAICLLWSNVCFAVSASDYYPSSQEDGVVLKDQSSKLGQLYFYQAEEIEEKESEEDLSKDCTGYNSCISCLAICPSHILSLYDSALLSSPPLKRYLLFHALKLDC
ncbi:MAG: hypothetical protein ACRBG0_20640 [Lewinella sp.]|uniref:hypothetical protein n=1 Tax=Lewinella sp. TaxID=2004506 RepID=UPI003D6A89B3